MIEVVNKYKHSGTGEWVARPSPLGNPWSHLKNTTAKYRVSSRDEACDKYAAWLPNAIKEDGLVKDAFEKLLQKYRRDGKLILVCYCAPARCHAETIAQLIQSAF